MCQKIRPCFVCYCMHFNFKHNLLIANWKKPKPTTYVFQGKPKKNESLWSIARGVFRMLRKNYGCVRVDFAQPFSLKVSLIFWRSFWMFDIFGVSIVGHIYFDFSICGLSSLALFAEVDFSGTKVSLFCWMHESLDTFVLSWNSLRVDIKGYVSFEMV